MLFSAEMGVGCQCQQHVLQTCHLGKETRSSEKLESLSLPWIIHGHVLHMVQKENLWW